MVWNKSKWYSILLIGLVLLLASSVIGCGQAYTKEDLDAAREAGYAQGHTAGYTEGFEVGYDKGYQVGLAQKESDESTDEIKLPPVIEGFSASPAEISAGGSATLHWVVTGATTVTIDQGIGNVSATGTQEVSPATTTSYTLTASNDKGTVTESVKVIVTKPGIPWDEAKYHIGERATVSGPVAGTKYGATSSGKPTWLNIGKDYPSSERFVVIIWGENRGNFPQPPEDYYLGKTICVTGLITEYNGIPQIEVKDPSQIQEQ